MLLRLNVVDQLLPLTYGVSMENNAILLEDLATKGYKLPPVHPGFNVFEMKMILMKLASFHAAGAVLQESQPNIFKNFKHGLSKGSILNSAI